jgi:hypothetical protein
MACFGVLLIGSIILKLNTSCDYAIPKPHRFTIQTLESNMDISQIITDINSLLPQLSSFISQFNNLVVESGINVITDSAGNMSIDIPNSMPESQVTNVTTRISIIDRLITTRGQELNDLFQKGLQIENNLKTENSNYTSQLTEKIAEFKKLNESYKH